MKTLKYKIQEYDLINDVWFLKKKIWGPFYKKLGVGSRAEVESKADELNGFYHYTKEPNKYKEAIEQRENYIKELKSWINRAVELANGSPSTGFSTGFLDLACLIVKQHGNNPPEEAFEYCAYSKYPGPITLTNYNIPLNYEAARLSLKDTHICGGGGQIDVDLYAKFLIAWKLNNITIEELRELKKSLILK